MTVIQLTPNPWDRVAERLATPLSDPAESLVAPSLGPEVRALIALTDKIARHRAGEALIIRPELDYVGDYKPYILGPFSEPRESRFSDGSFGVLYAGESIDTALDEALYWLTRFYTDGAVGTGAVATKQHFSFRTCGNLLDVRMEGAGIPSIYDPNDYSVSRAWGAQLREQGDGVWYDSIRSKGGECVGLFIPRIVSDVRMHSQHEFTWNGTAFTTRKEITPL